jgi:hypothetical protein
MMAQGLMLDLRLEFDMSKHMDYPELLVKEGKWVQRSFYDSMITAKFVAEKITNRHFIRDIIINPVDCDGIHGQSAGLMLCLRLISYLLHDRNIIGDHFSGTGSIDDDGNVLPVAYIAEKSAAAFAAGYSTFLHNNEGPHNSEQGFIRVHTVQEAWAIVSACPCAACQWRRRVE